MFFQRGLFQVAKRLVSTAAEADAKKALGESLCRRKLSRFEIIHSQRTAMKRAFLKALPSTPEPPAAKAASAYALFTQSKAKELFKGHADLDAKDRLARVSSQLSSEWKSLTSEDKKVSISLTVFI
jgi:hypothetical protein